MKDMAATEAKARWDELYKEALAAEKRNLKRRLRAAIARKDKTWIFAYCIQQRAAVKKANMDMMLYGTGMYEATEESCLWVLRYCRRLGVPFI